MLGIPLFLLRYVRCITFGHSRMPLNRFLCNLSHYRILSTCRFSGLQLPATIVQLKQYNRKYGVPTKRKCWNCHKSLETIKFSCLNCGVLQHPDYKMNYFELLDLPVIYDLDVDDISAKYKSLQMVFHPDRFARKSQEEMGISDLYSKLVNKAYGTLKNPLSRGLYILNLKGISTDDESVKMDKEFLTEILEKNEELEKIEDIETLKDMFTENSEIIEEHISQVSKAFEDNDLRTAQEVLMKMKYFVNIENEIKKKKSMMGVVD